MALEKMYSFDEIKAFIPISKNVFLSEIKNGNLIAKRIGVSYFVTESNLQAWLSAPSEPIKRRERTAAEIADFNAKREATKAKRAAEKAAAKSKK